MMAPSVAGPESEIQARRKRGGRLDEPHSFGELLRGYRVRARLTQEALAAKAELSVRGIADLERGTRRFPYLDTVRRLSHSLELSPAQHDELVKAGHRPVRIDARSSMQQATGQAAKARHNLPLPISSFIGREHEREQLQQLLGTTRLLTVTGPGGIGKTRLALAVAAELVATHRDGVWLVNLAAVHAPELVPFALATVLGHRERPGEAVLDALVIYLSNRELLLVLDNCEHLIDGCASLAERLLSGCPRVKLLATSRERLRIAGEVTWRVPPLAAPDRELARVGSDFRDYPAVQLFVERAKAVQADFALGPASASAVAAICARLAGLPLALELAAARVSALSVAQLLARLDDSFQLLVGGSRTAPTRQQTMRATLDWSHGLLAGPEQAVFRRLAVFAGGWTLEAAEAVCTFGDIGRSDVLDLLSQLIEKSLVSMDEQDGRSRYHLLEPVRQYARERLVASDELDMLRRRHASYFSGLAEAQERGANLGGAQRASAVQVIESEYRNLQAALQYALDTGDADLGLRLAWSLQHVWKFFLPLGEGQLWLDQLLRLPGAEAPTPARAVALLTAGWLAWFARGDDAAAATYYAEGLSLAHQVGDAWIISVALSDQGIVAEFRGDNLAARGYWEAALAVTQTGGDRIAEAIALNNLGRLTIAEGNYAAGRTRCEQALGLAREVGDLWVTSMVLEALGLAALAQGELATARSLAQECLSLDPSPPRRLKERALRTLINVGIADRCTTDVRRDAMDLLTLVLDSRSVGVAGAGIVETFAGVAALLGRPDVALRLVGAAEAAWEASGANNLPVYHTLRDRWLVPLCGGLPEEDAQRWWAGGRALSLDDAVALAQSTLLAHPSKPVLSVDRGQWPTSGTAASSPPAAPPYAQAAERLTLRQREVAALIGLGLTNRKIAERLVVSERTVAAHVEHILDKLGFASRHQVAVWAADNGLLT
jgi:predicted ATPase/DNA-binding CsgD family transcriptional regulator/Tfp pilus assembly protein PilF/DNA-binding XRE family transcriptional regulator